MSPWQIWAREFQGSPVIAIGPKPGDEDDSNIPHWLRACKLRSVSVYSGHGKTNLPRPDSRDPPRPKSTHFNPRWKKASTFNGWSKKIRPPRLHWPMFCSTRPSQEDSHQPFFFLFSLLTIDSQKEKLKIKISRIFCF